MDQVVKHESVAECHTDADGKTVQTKSNYLETEGSFAKSNEYKSDDGKEVSSKSKEVQSSAARLEQSKTTESVTRDADGHEVRSVQKAELLSSVSTERTRKVHSVTTSVTTEVDEATMRKLLNLDADAPTPFYPFAGQEISSKSQVTTVTKGDRHVNVSSTLLPSGEEVVTSSESGSTATVTTVTATNKGNTDLLDLATKTTPTAKEQASTKTPEAKTDDVLEEPKIEKPEKSSVKNIFRSCLPCMGRSKKYTPAS